MKRYGMLALGLAGALLLTQCKEKEASGPKGGGLAEPVFPQDPFPSGYGWLTIDTTLLQSDQGKEARTHGYDIFAGLMSASGESHFPWLWQTWNTATQAYAMPGSTSDYSSSGTKSQELNFVSAQARLKGTLDATIAPLGSQVVKPNPIFVSPENACQELGESAGCTVPANGLRLQDNGDVLIAGVIYNGPAYNHIRNNHLYNFDSVTKNFTSTARTTIPVFPDSAIVLKPMLWPVSAKQVTPLPIFPADCYYGDCAQLKRTAGYLGPENTLLWDEAVAIHPPGLDVATESGTVPVKYLFGVEGPYPTQTYDSARLVALDKFFYFQVDSATWASFNDVDRAIIQQSAYWIYGKPFEVGDYLALVAMHVMTREISGTDQGILDWTFQSFWWDYTQDRFKGQNGKSFNEGQSEIATKHGLSDGPFDYYVQTSTYGMGDPKTWPIAYNVYIELAAAHPIQTNCRSCHMRGGMPHTNVQAQALGLDTLNPVNLAQYVNSLEPSSLARFKTWSDTVFSGQVTTDFQWALPDRVNPQE